MNTGVGMPNLVYQQEVTTRVVDVTAGGEVLAEAVEETHEDVINFGEIDASVGDEIRAQIKGHTGDFYAAFPYSKSVRPEEYEVHGKEKAEEKHRERQQKQRDEKLLEEIRERRTDHDESRRQQPTAETTEDPNTDRTDDLRGLAVQMGIEETTEEQEDPHEK